MKTLFNNKGMSLIVLIVIMLGIGLIGGGVAAVMSSKQKSYPFALNSLNAYEIANAGAEIAIRYGKDANPFSYSYAALNADLINKDFGGGTFTANFNSGTLTSTGTYRGVTRQVRIAGFATFAYPAAGTAGPPTNETPAALTDLGSGFTNDLSALDLTKSGDRVVVQGYSATGGVHAYWASFQHLGEADYRFEDPEQPGRNIGWHVAPISGAISDNLRVSWEQYRHLNYDVQIKNGWDLHKDSGGSGIAFRWHESPLVQANGWGPPAGNDPYRYYQGYGITFMLYKNDSDGSNDLIPNNIKPGGGSLKKKLLLILWEQKVDAGGVPTKDWLAYAELGDPDANHDPATERHHPDPDQKVTGYQGWPDGRLNDDATIVVRVEDMLETTGGVITRYNDIKVFYGDASPNPTWEHDSRTKDNIAINKQRARYYPQWLQTPAPTNLPVINPRWPSNKFRLDDANQIAYWFDNLTTDDYFSLTNTDPMAPYNSDGHAVVWVKNNSPRTGAGFSAVNLLADNCTIRTTDFTLDAFPSGRKEIGLVGMGDITGANYTVAFDDFYIQILGGY